MPNDSHVKWTCWPHAGQIEIEEIRHNGVVRIKGKKALANMICINPYLQQPTPSPFSVPTQHDVEPDASTSSPPTQKDVEPEFSSSSPPTQQDVEPDVSSFSPTTQQDSSTAGDLGMVVEEFPTQQFLFNPVGAAWQKECAAALSLCVRSKIRAHPPSTICVTDPPKSTYKVMGSVCSDHSATS